jgi:hypothetical protein
MGIFDVFRRGSGPKPSSSGPSAEPPQPPFLATIASYEPVDGLGTLEVGGGDPLRFGRSACRGFEPAVGVTVEVAATSAHPLGGWRATEVSLKSDAATYDELLSRRDAALGFERKPLDPIEKAVAVSRVMGWVIVLLNDPPPRGPAMFAEWAQRLGLQAAGIRVGTEGTLTLGAEGCDAIAYVGEGPFPRQRLADLGAPETLQAGRGFIGLSLGLPGRVPQLRATCESFDPWAVGGQMRAISRIALELSKHGPAVLLPQSASLLSAAVFGARLRELDDPRARPFEAWMATAVSAEFGRYSSYGMVLQGQPNVEVAVDVNDVWELDRAREAILAACSTMVHSNEELKPGDRLVVPVGQPIDALPMVPIEGDAETYLVERRHIDEAAAAEAHILTGISSASGSILLRRTESGGVRARWAVAPAGQQPRLAFNSYQELLRHALAARLEARRFAGFTSRRSDDSPPFEIDVWEARANAGYFMTSNGVGRVPQLFGRQDDRTDHVEFVAAMQAHHPVIANAMAAIASLVHQQKNPSEVFRPGDTVGVGLSEVGAAGFVVADAGSISIADGPMIHLLEFIPLPQAEYTRARESGSSSLLERVGTMSPATRGPRWRLTLA